MSVLLAASVLSKGTELFSKGKKDLVLVVQLVLEEWNKLLACALRAKSESDGRESTDRSESK